MVATPLSSLSINYLVVRLFSIALHKSRLGHWTPLLCPPPRVCHPCEMTVYEQQQQQQQQQQQ